MIHTQLEVTKDGKIVKLESRVTHEGDWTFGAAEHLRFTQEEKWDEIPGQARHPGGHPGGSRRLPGQLGDPAIKVPHGTPCARLQGRMYTVLGTRMAITATWGRSRRSPK